MLARSLGLHLKSKRPLSCTSASAATTRLCGHRIRQASSLPDLPIFRALASHDPDSTSVVHSVSGRSFNYGNLLSDVCAAQSRLAQIGGQSLNAPLKGRPIAFLAENGYDYVVTLLSILAADGIALPLSPPFPVGELRYILDNSQTNLLLATEKYAGKAQEVVADGVPVLEAIVKTKAGGEPVRDLRLEEVKNSQQGGMMLYTSGTTNRPKGVLLPHSALAAQTRSLVEAWSYSPADRLLHLLPLHHIHGTVNAILAPLLAGSSIEFMFPFNPTAVWNRLAAPFLHQRKQESKPVSDVPITFLTAVPTIYNSLLSSHRTLPSATQTATRTAISPQTLRLNISGSAALPTPTKAAWSSLSNGNVLLERYGMTEVGMALSCGLGFADRVDGSVGWPLPSVEARLFDTDANEVIQPGHEIDANGRERVGEIQLRGPSVFKEYWRNETATREEFVNDPDGNGKWFKTGDMAIRKPIEGAGQNPAQSWAQGPMYFIQGRKSVDIIKNGGEKVSALEVERELLSLPQVTEAAVLGLPSEQWGQKVAVVLVLDKSASAGGRAGKRWSVLDMRRALKEKLAAYKIPQEMKVLEGGLPRNAMGKVNKKLLAKEVFPDIFTKN